MIDGNTAALNDYEIQQDRPYSAEHYEALEALKTEKALFIQKLLDGGSTTVSFKPNHSHYTIADCFDYLPKEALINFPIELDMLDEYNEGRLQHLEIEIEAAVNKLADEVFGHE